MEIEITWKIARKIWFNYIFFRWVIRLILMIPMYSLLNSLSDLLQTNDLISFLLCLFIFIALVVTIEIYPIKIILSKNFGEFRLVLVKTTDAEE